MRVDLEEVRRIAALAELELEPTVLEELRHQLGAILDYVARLDELEVSGVVPTESMVETGQPLREDEPRPCLAVADALANAPEHDADHFRVPQVLTAGR